MKSIQKDNISEYRCREEKCRERYTPSEELLKEFSSSLTELLKDIDEGKLKEDEKVFLADLLQGKEYDKDGEKYVVLQDGGRKKVFPILRELRNRNVITGEQKNEIEKIRSKFLEQGLGSCNSCTDILNYKKKEQKKKQKEAKSLKKLLKKTEYVKVIDESLKKEKEIQEKILVDESLKKNIFNFNNWKFRFFWIIYISSLITGIRWYIKEKKKEREINNPIDEIKDEFYIWRLDIYFSLAFYVNFFILASHAIDKFLRSNAKDLLKNGSNVTFGITAICLGVLFVLDGIVSSKLKTNLQRLSFSIERNVHDKNLKKRIFFKTQDSTETLKEDFKRFGMLTIPSIIAGVYGPDWTRKLVSNIGYLVPVIYASYRIWEVNKILKKLKEEDTKIKN